MTAGPVPGNPRAGAFGLLQQPLLAGGAPLEQRDSNPFLAEAPAPGTCQVLSQLRVDAVRRVVWLDPLDELQGADLRELRRRDADDVGVVREIGQHLRPTELQRGAPLGQADRA